MTAASMWAAEAIALTPPSYWDDDERIEDDAEAEAAAELATTFASDGRPLDWAEALEWLTDYYSAEAISAKLRAVLALDLPEVRALWAAVHGYALGTTTARNVDRAWKQRGVA